MAPNFLSTALHAAAPTSTCCTALRLAALLMFKYDVHAFGAVGIDLRLLTHTCMLCDDGCLHIAEVQQSILQ